ncbi:MarR family winged helix-turn-helix transcriptional regulator [Mycolicibacterium arenosum]|uniref:MarR family transcriptional regulator n=1 Tax=Mycolicibacterium arenosum TaxID=2952157 RepID=A0ABT1M201_9MYCO|nr:MarR family transcriptional regulator [Mycolicibacterium sp. CAU 1645]MCP9273175.1 MarR family transcriptional regulator [Mycolicibacterium sp. CAU 1645]
MGEGDARHTSTGADERLADLADVILALARTISTDAHLDPGIVDLTSTEINVMRFVDRNPGASPAAVAAATGLQRSNLSRALRDLEAKGMVRKSSSESDGRQARLHSTARAAENLKRLRTNWTRLLTSAGADRRNLDAALTMLTDLEAGLSAP